VRRQLVCGIGFISIVWLALFSLAFAPAQARATPIESSLEQRLGRRINRQMAQIGRLLWFDTITAHVQGV
jgi:hypothetical protein